MLVRSNAVLVIFIESKNYPASGRWIVIHNVLERIPDILFRFKHELTEFNPGQLLNPYWGLGVSESQVKLVSWSTDRKTKRPSGEMADAQDLKSWEE